MESCKGCKYWFQHFGVLISCEQEYGTCKAFPPVCGPRSMPDSYGYIHTGKTDPVSPFSWFYPITKDGCGQYQPKDEEKENS